MTAELILILMICEEAMSAGCGNEVCWTGKTALPLFTATEKKHGRLFTAHTPPGRLRAWKDRAHDEPEAPLLTSEQMRELALSVLGSVDTGIYHTRRYL